jgi:hypothetical protein
MAISLSGSLEITGSIFASEGITGSFSGTATSASYATNADLLDNRDSTTFANTGSNAFAGSQNINGNVAITGSLTTTGTITAQTINVQQVTSSIVYSSGSNVFGNSVSNTQSMTGSVGISGSLAVAGAGTFTAAVTPLIIKSTNATTMYTEYYYNTSTVSGYIGNGGGLLSGANNSDFIIRSEADFVVATGGNNRRLTITSGGNVIVGGTTAGTVLSTSITVNNATAANFAGFIPMTANTERGYFAGSSAGLEIGVAGSGTFIIYTGANERMRITSGGNVLIGSSTDNGGKLQVTGAAAFSSTITAASVNVVYNNAITNSTTDGVTLASYTTGASNELLQLAITLTNNNTTTQVRCTINYTTDNNNAVSLGVIATTPLNAFGEGQAVVPLNVKNGTTLTVVLLATAGPINWSSRIAITKIL